MADSGAGPLQTPAILGQLGLTLDKEQRLRSLAEAHEEVVPSPELELETTQGAPLGRRGAAEERRGAPLGGAVDHHEDLLQSALLTVAAFDASS